MIRYLWLILIFLISNPNYAQKIIRGKVVDEDYQPIAGAHIFMGDVRTLSDVSGVFELKSDESNHDILRIQALGFFDYEDTVPTVRDTLSIFMLVEKSYDLDLVTLTSSWIKPGQPFTYSHMSEEEIRKQNLGRDVPFLLQNLPSTVVTSDAGTGIGYTGIRIRGTDPSRINVTIDGVPLNDSESHGVFWVDLPDLAAHASALQVQRGVGTSTQGAGAFGATINVRTLDLQQEPYAEVDLTGGSFKTNRVNLRFGTGTLGKRIYIQGSLSRIGSDGFIDRAFSRLSSGYLSLRYLDNRQSLKINLIRGEEVTYQAWNGVPAQYIDDPSRRTFNSAGMKRDGTFHDNEVDDYGQTHLHIIYQRHLSTIGDFQQTFHYTRGRGFFEQYRVLDNLADYNTERNPLETDLIRRRWLDNNFYGWIFSLSHPSGDHEWKLGGGLNYYDGRHFGEVIWQEVEPLVTPWEYYRNHADKWDIHTYVQYQIQRKQFSFFGDFQVRSIIYSFEDPRESFPADRRVTVKHVFPNPKVGVEYQTGPWSNYMSLAMTHREPNRDDYTQSSASSRPRPERLIDLELGTRFKWNSMKASFNFYHMKYHDQLVLTGEINDVGAYNRVNVAQSYRQGIELEFNWELGKSWLIQGNATWSKNRIRDLVEAVDNWDTGEQEIFTRRNVPISFSPAFLGFTALTYKGLIGKSSNIQVSLTHKFVGRQYLDNSGRPDAILNEFQQSDLQMQWLITGKRSKIWTIKCQIINLFDQNIISNGWVYRYISEGYDATPDDPHATHHEGGNYTLRGYYPQAGMHILAGVSLQF